MYPPWIRGTNVITVEAPSVKDNIQHINLKGPEKTPTCSDLTSSMDLLTHLWTCLLFALPSTWEIIGLVFFFLIAIMFNVKLGWHLSNSSFETLPDKHTRHGEINLFPKRCGNIVLPNIFANYWTSSWLGKVAENSDITDIYYFLQVSSTCAWLCKNVFILAVSRRKGSMEVQTRYIFKNRYGSRVRGLVI